MKHHCSWRRGLLVLAVALVVTGGLVASADAITFNYSNQGGFTFGTETSTDFTLTVFGPGASGLRFFGPQPDNNPPLPVGPQYSTIGWGGATAENHDPSSETLVNPIGQASTSALKIETLAGTISDNGVPQNVALLTHQNANIFPRFLNTVVIDTILRLTDGATPVNIGSGETNSVAIRLFETNNTTACDPDIQIDPGGGGIPCSDYFVFPLVGLFTPLTFNHLGVNYTLKFGLTPLGGTIFETVDCANPAAGPVDPNTFGGALCGRIRTAEASTNQILITMSLTSVTPPVSACPRTQGFWKNHRDAVLDALEGIGFLVVGGQNYTADQLITILQTPPKKGNATYILVHQLIATKLNLLTGSDSAPILATVLAADALLAGLPTPLAFVQASTPLGQQMTALATTLDNYNNGANTPTCTGPR